VPNLSVRFQLRARVIHLASRWIWRYQGPP